MNYQLTEVKELAKFAYEALDDKKAEDIKVLDIHEISIMADVFIIASGNNPNQLKAMADAVEKRMMEQGHKLIHLEGYQTARWILLDFGTIVVHLFHKEDRMFYNLERIWGDAKVVSF